MVVSAKAGARNAVCVRLGSHGSPTAVGRFAGGQHVGTHCGAVAGADALHMSFEYPALQPLRQQYAPLFSTNTDTSRSCFAQLDHMQDFKYVLSCLDFLQICPLSSCTGDQTCWLAKAL